MLIDCHGHYTFTGAHYINGDTTAFMQFLTPNLCRDFPALKFIIPHGGGAVPYHWVAIAAWRRTWAGHCCGSICSTT